MKRNTIRAEDNLPKYDVSALDRILRDYVQSTLFNSYYLGKGFPEHFKENFIPLKDSNFTKFYGLFCKWVLKQDESVFLKIQPSETTTIDRYIMPVMSFLGWDTFEDGNSEFTNRETTYYYGENAYKPDLVYFHNSKDAQKVDKLKKSKEEQKLHTQQKHSVLVEAKKFGLLKNKVKATDDKKDDATKDRSPEEQTVIYMDMLHSKFAFLSDGGIWKLFHSDFRDKDKFLSFDMGKLCLLILNVNKLEGQEITLDSDNSKVLEINLLISFFYNLFSQSAYYGQLETVNHLLKYTHKYSAHLDENMKDRFIMAMNWACNGLVKSVEDSGEDPNDYLELIQKTAESHLFNVIFFRSLESRGILPYYDEDNDYKKISISKTVDEIYAQGFDPSANFEKQLSMFSDYYDQQVEKKTKVICKNLISLYKTVHAGYKDFRIKGFKESVFTKEEWSFANKHLINDQHMMNVIFYLSLVPKGDRSLNEYQLIPFDFLTPIEIGSIYESFLEFKLEKSDSDLFWNFDKKQWVKNKNNAKGALLNEIIKKGDYVFTPNNEDRKMTGAFYTPHCIVTDVVNKTLNHVVMNRTPKQMLELKIIDPAMGSGHFISHTLDYLVDKYLDSHVKHDEPLTETYSEVQFKVLKSCLYGVDVNSSAIKLAKMSLWMKIANANENLDSLDSQIVLGDSIFQEYKKHFKFYEKHCFDAVVMNPPWGAELTKEQKQTLKKRFPTVDSSTPNSFAYFLGLASELTNMNIGAVLPDSFLIKDFAKLRSSFLPHIDEITWHQNTQMPVDSVLFKGVKHDFCCVYSKHLANDVISVGSFKYSTTENKLLFNQKRFAKTDYTSEMIDNVFPIEITPQDIELKHRMLELPRMEVLIKSHEGIHSGNVREKLFIKRQINTNCKPVFVGGGSGDEIDAFNSTRSGWFVNYNKKIIDADKGEYASLREEEIFSLPKVYVTRTGNPLLAFYNESDYASNNFFSLQFENRLLNTETNLRFLECYINSQVCNYFIRTFFAPRVGSMYAETKIVHLKKLPFPFETFARREVQRIATISRNIEQLKSGKPTNTTASRIQAHLDEIEEIFRRLLGVDEIVSAASST